MQACRAYYAGGQFVPLEPLEIPEGSQAIVTILDFSLDDVSRRQRTAMERFRAAVRASDPLPPEFDSIISQRVSVSRRVDL